MAHPFIAEPAAEYGNSDSGFSDNGRQPPRPLRISVLTSIRRRWRAPKSQIDKLNIRHGARMTFLAFLPSSQTGSFSLSGRIDLFSSSLNRRHHVDAKWTQITLSHQLPVEEDQHYPARCAGAES
jgi:hypothetical protein